MKIVILFFGIVAVTSCNKNILAPNKILTSDTLTYHIYNSKGMETNFIKVFDHPISAADSNKFLNESIAKSLLNKY